MLFSLSSTNSRWSLRFTAVAVCALSAGSAAAAPYQSYKTATCSAASTCFVNFPAAPAGQRLVITNVSCLYKFPYGAIVRSAELVVNGSGIRDFLTPLPLGGELGGDISYSINQNTLLHIPAGSTFRAQMTLGASANQSIACKVAGTSEP